MLRLVTLGHHGGKLGFVEAGIVEADGAGIHRLARGQLRHHGDHRAGVHAAGEKGTQWHFRDHADIHRFAQAFDQFSARLLFTAQIQWCKRHVPVLPGLGNGVIRLQAQGEPRRQLARLLENRLRFRHVAKGKVILNGLWIQFPLQLRMDQQGLQLGGKDKQAVGQLRIVEGLDAQAVTRQKQAPPVAVPQGKGKHAAETLHTGLAPLFPGMHNDLGVAVGAEYMAGGPQFPGEFLEVVDLAVVDHHHGIILVEQRLLAAGEIDDGQAPVAEAKAGLGVNTAFIGTAMKLELVHALQQALVDRASAARIKNSDYATHVVFTYSVPQPAARRMPL